MIFNLLNEHEESPIIKVIGVGGGGSNAVNHMYKQGIVGVDFAICNTDAQAMAISPVPVKLNLGPTLTEGRGAGSKPNIGKLACEESIDEVKQYLTNGCKMLFITAGMGGGTGTGAAPIIAKAAKEMDILTVGIVTVPFVFEGRRRMNQALAGLEELKNQVDTLVVVSNDKLRQIHGNLSLSDAFAKADNILTTAAKGIAEIITVPGYVNVDFEDVNTVMRDSGVAIMGTATAEGENRAKKAVDEALNSPLLEDNNIRGAQHILLNITSGRKEVTMDEIFEITEFVQEEAGNGTDLIWGNCFDESLDEAISVTVIATGFEQHGKTTNRRDPNEKIVVSLDEPDNFINNKPTNRLAEITSDETPMEGSGTTFEFEDLESTIKRYQKKKHSVEAENAPSEEDIQEERQRRQREDARRRERLRSNRPKLNNPNVVSELENEPAYLRRGVRLDDVPASDEPAYSKWTITDDDEPELSKGNSYLHDNVD